MSVKKENSSVSNFTFIDLFAGIGGMRKGFESFGGRCVFTSEWDTHSQKTYKANFGDEDIAGDIRQVESETIPDHDILLAGFPCQPFSIAGVSKKNSLGKPHGFECKTQGTLFFEVARIIRDKKPRAFLLENVKNLVRHDSGNTFRVICDTLDELGYYFDWKVLDAKGLVPQHRERIFIAGFREDNGFAFGGVEIPAPGDGPKLGKYLHPQDGSQTEEPPYTEGPQGKVASKYTLSPKLWQYLQDYAAKHKAKGNGFGYGLFGPDDTARTLSARYYKDGSEILLKQDGQRPRRLTPRECAWIMGFDSPGETTFKIVVSDTQAYRQFGNAVAVPVIRAIAQGMMPYLSGKGERHEAWQQKRIPLDAMV